jgi:hypothetical protein
MRTLTISTLALLALAAAGCSTDAEGTDKPAPNVVACDAGLATCAQACVELATDRNNCGACGKSCGIGESCVAGACACPAEKTVCADACVDVATSVNHCGTCDARCDAGQTCSGGKCTGEPLAWRERVLDEKGDIDPVAYDEFAGAMDVASVDHRLGPDYAFFHGNTTEELPLVYERPGAAGLFYSGDCRLENYLRYWTGAYAGNILYVPEDATRAGIDRVRFSWHYGDATGEASCYIMRTDLEGIDATDSVATAFAKSPDPSVSQQRWLELAGGAQPLHPVAIARSRFDWSHAGVVAFAEGIVGATGYGNNNDKYPVVALGANKVPTAVAVSNNNELAFVTVWDKATHRGQLAVIALEGRALSNIGDNAKNIFRYIGLMNIGGYSRMKLLGFVDLPFAAPTSVSVMTDGALNGAFLGERFPPEDRPFPRDLLDTQEARDFWANEPAPPVGYRARGGYVMVASRAESQIAFVDIGPLIRWIRSMYFTTQERFDQTKNEGDAPDQWPFTFEVAPEATPQVTAVLDVPQPTTVAAGWPRADSLAEPYNDPRERAYATTLDGQLLMYNVGGWLAAQPLAVESVRSVKVGRNPTALSIGHNWNSEDGRHQLIVVSRGDREVSLLTPEGEVVKTLRDQRMLDPVSAQTTENHDIRISDFHGKQVLTYLYRSLGKRATDREKDGYLWTLGPDGTAEWEFTHAFPRPGSVFHTSSVLFY